MCLEMAVPSKVPRTPHENTGCHFACENSGGTLLGCASPETRCEWETLLPSGRGGGLAGGAPDSLAGRGPRGGALDASFGVLRSGSPLGKSVSFSLLSTRHAQTLLLGR